MWNWEVVFWEIIFREFISRKGVSQEVVSREVISREVSNDLSMSVQFYMALFTKSNSIC